MRCSKCGFDNPGGMKFCGQCTTLLALVCPNCHFGNPPGFKFCGHCTTALGSDSAKPRSSDPVITASETESSLALDAERKMVTALFADIKGSMELMEDLDPEEARAAIDPALKLMIDPVHRYWLQCATTAQKGGPDGHLKQPCCATDEGRRLEAGGQAQASNHCKLHRSKAHVVSVAEKAGLDSVR
jgi:hypothetical protein